MKRIGSLTEEIKKFIKEKGALKVGLLMELNINKELDNDD